MLLNIHDIHILITNVDVGISCSPTQLLCSEDSSVKSRAVSHLANSSGGFLQSMEGSLHVLSHLLTSFSPLLPYSAGDQGYHLLYGQLLHGKQTCHVHCAPCTSQTLVCAVTDY